ncbi:MAG: hypothetical protein GY785_24845 [Gammaproteobacteria bacterium]|nr:hypothetical protein [Gammaproteobacteria bacterium]
MISDKSIWEGMLFGICLALLAGFGSGSDDSSAVDLKGVYIDSPEALTGGQLAVVSGKLDVTVPFDESFSTTFQLSWENHSSGESGSRQIAVSGSCTESWAVVLIFPVPILDCTHDDTWEIEVPLVNGGNGISVTVGNRVAPTTVVRKEILQKKQKALRVS